MSDIYTVKFIPSNVSSFTCFFYLNENSTRKIVNNPKGTGSGLEIRYGESYSKITYGSFLPLTIGGLDDNSVGINSKYAFNLGINENDKILLKRCEVREISSVIVAPKNQDDYSILEESKYQIENVLMYQIRVVTRNQYFPVKVFGNVFIELYVEKLEPDVLFGQLKKFTKLEIASPRERNEKEEKETLTVNPLMSIARNLLNNFKGNKPNQRDKFDAIFKIETNEYRVVPSVELSSNIPFDIRDRYIFVHHLKSEREAFGPCFSKKYCRIVKTSEKSPKIFFTNFVISLNDSEDNLLYCPKKVLKKFNVSLGSKVTLEEAKYVKHKNFKIYKNCFPTKFSWDGISEIKNSITSIIQDNIEYNQRINSIIIGNVGTGKTYLAEKILEDLNDNEIHAVKLDCKPLRGKKIESLLKILNEKLTDCCKNQPAVLIIDDLDALTYLNEENEQQFNNLYSNRIGNLIEGCVKSYQTNYISLIATAQKLGNLANLNSIRGPRLFENVEIIPEMTVADRKSALKILAAGKKINLEDSVLSSVSENTNGYNMQDLTDLIEKTLLKNLMRNGSLNLGLNLIEEDFDSALKETIPLSLRGVELHKNIPHKWVNVGGMTEAKKILTEVFAWPSKYPELFQSCPLRHQSGVLLYGAPGTGKTLIAGAVANECGLNFISIKGPELLSKYVGASEEGVRNLFVRAQKAQPCVLFFDEFDSLAPRRGHDSTGVTDRVVNQLLTQLDGVEALNGVYILAATSRPDLLDPALLRPGRLDRTVYCALPDKDDRESILRALSTKLKLSDDVDFDDIAEKSDGYTGADLQAVLYSAQMIPIKQLNAENYDSLSGKEIRVSQSDLLQALSETKPSMTSSEKQKYQRIYQRFISSRGSDFSDQTGKQQKVTFA